jgi:putative ABC transport system ATP-binding protein
VEILRAEELNKVYRHGPHSISAVRQVSLTISKGECICILGRSGSGKTTLLSMLGLLLIPTSGRIYIGEKEVRLSAPGAPGALAALRREHFGFIFQDFTLIPHLSAEENVALPLKYAGISRIKRQVRARAMLERVGLGERTGFKWEELSGGEAQRVAIARAMVNNPKMLFADEPTSELDSESSHSLLSLLTELRNEAGTALVIVSHDKDIASYATRVFSMKDGSLTPVPQTELQ